ncbi:MAG: TIR domain-containing protein [Promethearchaeota archaeon]
MLEMENGSIETAEAEEKRYNWVEAAGLYENAANSFSNENMITEAADFYRKSGYASARAADTIKTAEKHIEMYNNAIKAYTEAANLFKEIEMQPEELESKAEVNFYIGFLKESVDEAKESFNKAYNLFIKASEIYSKEDNQMSIARVNSRAAITLGLIISYCSDNKEIEDLFQKAIDILNKTWEILKDKENLQILAESLFAEFFINLHVIFFIMPFKRDNFYKQNAREFLSKCEESLRIVENCDDNFTLAMIYFSAGFIYSAYAFHFIEDEREQRLNFLKGLEYHEKGLNFATNSNEKKLTILSLFWLNLWAIVSGRFNYLQKRIINDINEIIELGKIYKHEYSLWYFYANFLPGFYYGNFAQRSFIPLKQRQIYAKKGIEYTKNSLKNLSFGPFCTWAYQMLTWSYSQMVILTTEEDQQDKYARKMLYFAKQAKDIGEKYRGGNAAASFNSSQYRAYKTMADIAKNKQKRINMLSAAIESAKNYIKHAVESRTGNIVGQVRLGLLLEELGITKIDINPLIEAKELFLETINECLERGHSSLAAATHEYTARIEDRLGNHDASAENYKKAQELHRESLKNIEYKPLKKGVQEKIRYAHAWSLIESAKTYHKREKHIKAKESYEKSVIILKKVHRYNYEAPYYTAWALLEEAEHLSKQGNQEEAIRIYKMTKIAFKNTIKKLKQTFKPFKEERKRIEKLEKVAKIRKDYCSARIHLEKGRILSKHDRYIEAAEKFAIAASQFRIICTVFKIKRERRELESIYYLCRAWENMALAEKYEDPERFAEAANLFKKASNSFIDTKLQLLASGNSAFCQALEYGCKFDESIEKEIKTDQYSKIKSMLRKAASLYEKGNFKSAADWALATSTYFDAAWHLIRVDEELDLDERGKHLRIGSGYLKSAAELFSKAGHQDKEGEVLNKLERIQKEELILISALSTIKEPSISRSTVGIVAPACPVEISQSPRLSEIREIAEESNRIFATKSSANKFKLSFKELRKSFKTSNKRKIFISYATKDSDYFQIPIIVENLKRYSEIEKISFWEVDSGENIVDFMEKTLRRSDTFILFCSENAMNSEAVKGEWQSAYQISKKGLIKIIPVCEDEKFVPVLLMPMLYVKFTRDNFSEFIENLYNEILR